MMDEAEFGGISEDEYNQLKKEVTMAKKKKKKAKKKKTKKRKTKK
jgi:hypothetical protein